MAGPILDDDSLEEDHPRVIDILFNLRSSIFPNHNVQTSSSVRPRASSSSSTSPRNALITSPPSMPLELRQNNPQDCANLIAASVDRATVEISRTIIALNATFSQQLQEASISASNGIKSAQVSATSTISIVVQSASVATSSAFSSVTVANRIATSANFALTSVQSSASTAMVAANSSIAIISSSLNFANLAFTSAQSTISNVNLALTSVSSASISDVARLSASLNVLQASVASIQSSAALAIGAAQSALASATGSAAAQASSILASAGSGASATQTVSTGPIIQLPPPLQQSPAMSLTPLQLAAIIIGAVVVSILLSFAIFFLVTRMKKRKERDSYLDEKDVSSSPRNLPARLSSTFRTGNAMTIKFNPPKSSEAPVTTRSPLTRRDESPITSSFSEKNSPTVTSQAINYPAEPPAVSTIAWPLASRLSGIPNFSFEDSTPAAEKSWPLRSGGVDQGEAAYTSGPTAFHANETLLDLNQNMIYDQKNQTAVTVSPTGGEVTLGKTTPEKRIVEPVDHASHDAVTETPEMSGAILVNEPEEMLPEDPFQDEINDPFEDPNDRWAENEVEELSRAPVEDLLPPAIVEKTTIVEPLEEVLEEPLQEVLIEPIQEPARYPSEKQIIQPDKIQTEESSKSQSVAVGLEPLLPPQSDRKPSPETLALLRQDDEPRNSTVPEIDTLLRIVAQQNEVMRDKPLFWSDFRAADVEVQEAMAMPSAREHSPLRESTPTFSPVIENPKSPAVEDRDRSLSPTRLHPVNATISPPQSPEPVEQPSSSPQPHKSILSQPLAMERIELSLPREDSRIRNITSMLAEHENNLNLTTDSDEASADDRQERGRSMLRTSDIIEARLSRIIRERDEKTAAEKAADEARERTTSPLRRNPVDMESIPTPAEIREKTLSPLRRNPSNVFSPFKPKSLTPSPKPVASRLQLVSTDDLPDRAISPLRRSPSNLRRKSRTVSPPASRSKATPSLLRPLLLPTMLSNLSSTTSSSTSNQPPALPYISPSRASSVPRPPSNAAFSQMLNKFQTLANQNPQDGIRASTEVTQRAIAGIYIPGSLREQAVRNLRVLSRSRSRGGDGLGRSASQPGGRGN
ncbi:hypothetical protein B0J14DRAFT_568594 [Halenospora varia]|nr:hypothetical protein B0J14DRAFT_568594 [Halenospora varia]